MNTQNIEIRSGAEMKPQVVTQDAKVKIVAPVQGIGVKSIAYNQDKGYLRFEFIDTEGNTISKFFNDWRTSNRYKNSNKKDSVELLTLIPFLDLYRTYWGQEEPCEITGINDLWEKLFKNKVETLPTKIAQNKKLKLVFFKTDGENPEYRVADSDWFSSDPSYNSYDKTIFTYKLSDPAETNTFSNNPGVAAFGGTSTDDLPF